MLTLAEARKLNDDGKSLFDMLLVETNQLNLSTRVRNVCLTYKWQRVWQMAAAIPEEFRTALFTNFGKTSHNEAKCVLGDLGVKLGLSFTHDLRIELERATFPDNQGQPPAHDATTAMPTPTMRGQFAKAVEEMQMLVGARLGQIDVIVDHLSLVKRALRAKLNITPSENTLPEIASFFARCSGTPTDEEIGEEIKRLNDESDRIRGALKTDGLRNVLNDAWVIANVLDQSPV